MCIPLTVSWVSFSPLFFQCSHPLSTGMLPLPMPPLLCHLCFLLVDNHFFFVFTLKSPPEVTSCIKFRFHGPPLLLCVADSILLNEDLNWTQEMSPARPTFFDLPPPTFSTYVVCQIVIFFSLICFLLPSGPYVPPLPHPEAFSFVGS